MAFGNFIKNNEHGKTRDQLAAEINEVVCESIQRQSNGLDTEDQDWRERNLREALDSLN